MAQMNPDEYHITCPEGNESLTPAKVWSGAGGIVYGQFKKHHHHGQLCDYTDLVAPAETGAPPQPYYYGII